MTPEARVTPTLFIVNEADIPAAVATMSGHHIVVGHRVATEEQLRLDPRFAEWRDEIRDAMDRAYLRERHHPRGAVYLVLDIVSDPNEDDWFDAELVRELAADGVSVRFCCPGRNL